MGDFTYSPSDGRYRTATGALVSNSAIRDALTAITQDSGDRLAVLTERHVQGRLDTLAWREAMQKELRTAYGVVTSLARGGTSAMDPSTRGWLGGQLRLQYGWLSGFSLDLAQGRLTEAQALDRARMYADSAHGQYYAARQRERKGAGWQAERRVLGAAEHCTDCPGLAARGWQPIGSLPPPGQGCACRARCRCSMRYSAQMPEEVAV